MHKQLIRIFGVALVLSLTVHASPLYAADTRIADAAMQANKDAVRSLLKQKADVNAAQGDGMTALHWAAYQNDLEMAQLLIQAGASVNSTTRVGVMTPMFMACTSGNAAMIEAFLKAGADANSANTVNG